MNNTEDWKSSLLAAIGATNSAPGLKPGVFNPHRALLIREWRERFSKLFRDGDSVFDPIIQDLILPQETTGPEFPKLDLGEMHIADWTFVIRGCLLDPADTFLLPKWFLIPALERLGFSAPAHRLTMTPLAFARPPSGDNRDEDHLKDREAISQWSPYVRQEWRRGVVVLVHSTGRLLPSLTTSWKPSVSRRAAAMHFPMHRWESEIWTRSAILAAEPTSPSQLPDLKADLGIDTVLIELAIDDDSIQQILSAPSGLPLPQPFNTTEYRVFYLVSKPPRATQLPLRPVVIRKDLDETLAAVEEQTSV